MKHFTPRQLALAILAQLALSVAVVPLAMAQDAAALELEEVVITGTRRAARSAFDSAAPIDVISGDDFRNQGGSDLVDLIRNVVPSYNVNTQPISDAATVIRPANLRGLASDQTLVLINSKRRHRASVITWLGNGVSDGAQGPDISVIPSIALKQVEVLRDGASAQYGSDAIAGVMNFVLKDDTEGGSIEARYGEYTEEGENTYSVAANIGLPFTARGFVNLSFEYGESDDTDRSVQRDDAAGLIAAGNTVVANPAQIWGSPEIADDFKSIFNIGLELNDKQAFYAFGNYASKRTEGGFYFRNPNTRGGVFSNDKGETRLVGDLTEDGTGNCPEVPTGDAAALAAVIADPNCFVFNERFPGGFTPRFGGETEDAALVAGVRGTLDSSLHYDISAGLGYSDVDFFIFNTVNSSLGPNTPIAFDPGDYTQTEKNFNIDLSYPVEVAVFASDLNVAAGFEWRNEEFEITVGDQASFEIGPLAEQGFTAASNGFSGFSPLAGGNWDRSNIALYIDLETDITERWLLALAGRWEDFDDFGSTANGKIATHITVTDWLGLRATYSTGFRAPTPGQSNAYNVSTEFNLALGDLVNNGTIPSNNPVAQLRGGKALTPEKSTNYTLGVVVRAGNFNLTVDYFNIELKDRLALSRNFNLTVNERQDLIDSGVTSAGNLQNFRFFTNEIDTTTRGFDIVATWSATSSAGVTNVNLAYNRTQTEVDSGITANIGQTRIDELEEGLPDARTNLSVNHSYDNWRFIARYNRFAGWYDSEDVVSYDGYGTMDAEAAYTFEAGISLIVGANNILDQTPDENPGAAAGPGNKYSQFAPGGFNGALWYTRLVYDF